MISKLDTLSSDYLDITSLRVDCKTKAIAYVHDVRCKMSVDNKPYYVLYLRDVRSKVVRGYIFNVDSYIEEGTTLNALKNNFIALEFIPNSPEGWGISLRILHCYKILTPSSIDKSKFLGEIRNASNFCIQLIQEITAILEKPIPLSELDLMGTHLDYCGGRVGGVGYFYYTVFSSLKAYSGMMTQEEYKSLIGTFYLYLITDLNVIRNNDDLSIELLEGMTSKCRLLQSTLQLDLPVLEITHSFFGYTPTNIFVRILLNQVEAVKKSMTELDIFNITPKSLESKTPYGTIKR